MSSCEKTEGLYGPNKMINFKDFILKELTIDQVVSNKDFLSIFKLAFGPFTEQKLQNVTQEYKRDKSAKIIGCLADEKLVGIVGYTTTPEKTLYIKQIAVVPEHQRQSIGKQLIEFLLKEYNVSKIEAQTDQEAVEFYRKLGFECKPAESEYENRFQCTLKCKVIKNPTKDKGTTNN
jgi:ribosomal protein S18 acetylase RimI-like enzyme